jgi:hypothetical protein
VQRRQNHIAAHREKQQHQSRNRDGSKGKAASLLVVGAGREAGEDDRVSIGPIVTNSVTKLDSRPEGTCIETFRGSVLPGDFSTAQSRM